MIHHNIKVSHVGRFSTAVRLSVLTTAIEVSAQHAAQMSSAEL